MPKRKIDDVIAGFEDFHPGRNETENVARLYELLEEVESISGNNRLVPILFRFLETHHDVELGSPGPIVHALEEIAPNSKELAESLRRRPTFYTVSMVGRILNDNPKKTERTFWIEQVQKIESDPRISAGTRNQIREILKRHSS